MDSARDNQMLGAIALTVRTVVLLKMKRQRFAWVTIAPAAWLVLCTTTAGLEKVFSPDPSAGFISHALRYSDAIAAGKLLAPAKTLDEMNRIVFNDYIDASRAGGRFDSDLWPDQYPASTGQSAADRNGNRAR